MAFSPRSSPMGPILTQPSPHRRASPVRPSLVYHKAEEANSATHLPSSLPSPPADMFLFGHPSPTYQHRHTGSSTVLNSMKSSKHRLSSPSEALPHLFPSPDSPSSENQSSAANAVPRIRRDLSDSAPVTSRHLNRDSKTPTNVTSPKCFPISPRPSWSPCALVSSPMIDSTTMANELQLQQVDHDRISLSQPLQQCRPNMKHLTPQPVRFDPTSSFSPPSPAFLLSPLCPTAGTLQNVCRSPILTPGARCRNSTVEGGAEGRSSVGCTRKSGSRLSGGDNVVTVLGRPRENKGEGREEKVVERMWKVETQEEEISEEDEEVDDLSRESLSDMEWRRCSSVTTGESTEDEDTVGWSEVLYEWLSLEAVLILGILPLLVCAALFMRAACVGEPLALLWKETTEECLVGSQVQQSVLYVFDDYYQSTSSESLSDQTHNRNEEQQLQMVRSTVDLLGMSVRVTTQSSVTQNKQEGTRKEKANEEVLKNTSSDGTAANPVCVARGFSLSVGNDGVCERDLFGSSDCARFVAAGNLCGPLKNIKDGGETNNTTGTEEHNWALKREGAGVVLRHTSPGLPTAACHGQAAFGLPSAITLLSSWLTPLLAPIGGVTLSREPCTCYKDHLTEDSNGSGGMQTQSVVVHNRACTDWILQDDVVLGGCFEFGGGSGVVTIKLRRPILLTAVAFEIPLPLVENTTNTIPRLARQSPSTDKASTRNSDDVIAGPLETRTPETITSSSTTPENSGAMNSHVLPRIVSVEVLRRAQDHTQLPDLFVPFHRPELNAESNKPGATSRVRASRLR
eukprot:GHVQ01016637.1.p1 GENE.GHVQ01016637.1~~GHVQ01016637.1.p1  ORF type:complete len:797 (+),score=126.82 GHVQ01016637.1:576-2966(+)